MKKQKSEKNLFAVLAFVPIINSLSFLNLTKISKNKKWTALGIILFIIQVFLFILSLRLFVLPNFFNSMLAVIYRMVTVFNYDLEQITLISAYANVIIYLVVLCFYFVEQNKILKLSNKKRSKNTLQKYLTSKEEKSESKDKNSENIQTDINSASEEELLVLQGITIIDAKKAIAYRNQHSGFDSVDEFFACINAKPHIIVSLEKHLIAGEYKNVKTEKTDSSGKRIIDI